MCSKYYRSVDYEDWDELLGDVKFREGRPKSALLLRPHRYRCSSSLSLRERGRRRPNKKAEDESVVVGVQLERFRRSLRLLGLNVEDIAPLYTNREHKQSAQDKTSPPKKPNIRGAKPKVNTRLERRTVSAEDLKTAILLEDPDNLRFRATGSNTPSRHHTPRRNTTSSRSSDSGSGRSEAEGWSSGRELVARAVYEGWYFKKLEEAKSHRERALQEEKIKQWTLEHAKREQSEKSKECYEEWMNRKLTAKQKGKENREEGEQDKKKNGNNRMRCPTKPRNASEKAPRDRKSGEEAAAAFIAWKKEKDKELKKKMAEIEKKKRQEEENEKRKREADKAYSSWKKRVDEGLKEKAREREKEEDLKMRAEERIQEQKEKEAVQMFNAWKEKKDRELREKQARLREKEIADRIAKEEEKKTRRYEAEQAFLGWLDHVDQRLSH